MSTSRASRTFLLCIPVAAILLAFVLQHRELAEAHRQNAIISSELTARNTVAETPPKQDLSQADVKELARLRAEHGDLIRLRAEVAALHTKLRELTAGTTNPVPTETANVEKINAPFREVTTNDIPGRYLCTDTDEQGNVTKQQWIDLFPDGNFRTYWRPDGQPSISGAYKWALYPQGLILNWQRGMSFFQSVSSRGVYVSTRPDKTQLRIEKQEQQ